MTKTTQLGNHNHLGGDLISAYGETQNHFNMSGIPKKTDYGSFGPDKFGLETGMGITSSNMFNTGLQH
jgi:hypothetical protein